MTRDIAIGLFAGILFGAGLALSGMADPTRVRDFLDILGNWDPTLLFVMGGAIVPMAIAWFVRMQLEKPLAASRFALPDTNPIDARLLLGAVLFGIGWGISGLCPGPALVGIALVPGSALIFVVFMIFGMLMARLVARKEDS
ncbi:hypothetical protein SAMN02745824_0742 [Parasphingorhabdus marina DSM 22363]|uniref:Sulphur transport domain-containing protein n=1 Tax=Parasphingorhabdus marina DSM 22363 TaxID=1123272 RepID=A0A1N6CQJ5_9SPHN|nr:DUF6691 family protein [Parasphingorhabdus marina]SIN60787.1 hypothetical protein SAMN02745824_0742 [Parasphingorhabdus marina DSM 22363]